jgi:hypothetical protein
MYRGGPEHGPDVPISPDQEADMNVKALILFFVTLVDLCALAVTLHWVLSEAEARRPSNQRDRWDRTHRPRVSDLVRN